MEPKTSVALSCFHPGRAKDLLAAVNCYISDTVLLLTVSMFQVSQPYNSNAC